MKYQHITYGLSIKVDPNIVDVYAIWVAQNFPSWIVYNYYYTEDFLAKLLAFQNFRKGYFE